MKTWEEFLRDWVNDDPENEGCYTEMDVRIAYDEYVLDFEEQADIDRAEMRAMGIYE